MTVVVSLQVKAASCDAVKTAKGLPFNQSVSSVFDRLRRRRLLLFALSTAFFERTAQADLPCRGLNGYELRQCLKERRTSQRDEDVRETYLKARQFEQPGELVTLRNGLQYRYGDAKAVPLAVSGAMAGMQIGGRRRILVPPEIGWIDETIGPRPDTFGGYRRLEAHKDEPLLFEVELKRIQMPKGEDQASELRLPENAQPFSLPAPPEPTQR